MHISRQARVHLTLILVQALMASLAIAGKVILREVPPGFLVLVRIWGAAGVLLVVHGLAGQPRVRSRADLRYFAGLGLLGVTANQTLFLLGLRQTTAINATVLVTTIPVFTVLESLLTRREPASAIKVIGIALSAAGTIYLIGPDRISLAPNLALGNALIVLAMLAYSAYLVLSKGMLERYPPITVSLYVMLFGALFVLPVGLHAVAHTSFGAVSGRTWGLIGYAVLGPTILAYVLNIWALKRVSSNLVAVYIYLQPVFTAATAPLLLEGERITARTLIAALGIFAGLAAVIWAEREQRREMPLEPMVGE